MSSGRSVFASPLFGRKAKKCSKHEKRRLDEEVIKICEHPGLGQEKKGDLQGVRVHKFKSGNQQMLLAYQVTDREILLLTFGTHENYYRDLKNYLK